MTLTYDTQAHLTVLQYATSIGASDRTVKRWLAAGELPGAYQDERGRWMIPAGAERAASTDVIPLSPMTRPPTAEVVSHPAGMIDAMPSFLTIEQAAQLLGISRHAIATHREYFDVVPFGVNGSLVVPLATIKRIRG